MPVLHGDRGPVRAAAQPPQAGAGAGARGRAGARGGWSRWPRRSGVPQQGQDRGGWVGVGAPRFSILDGAAHDLPGLPAVPNPSRGPCARSRGLIGRVRLLPYDVAKRRGEMSA
ncbi:hypothetical protein QJS66_11300 [Kocuria rhizophila]|nr:hypothetical protein QJS66_11300 [Kocuria rhizophila]